MSFKEFFAPIVESLRESANVRTVYGDPISVEGKTLIPVAKAGYGFGGSRRKGDDGGNEEGNGRVEGGVMGAAPMGFLEVSSQEETKFIKVPDNNPAKLVGALFAGFVVGALIVTRRKRNEIGD